MRQMPESSSGGSTGSNLTRGSIIIYLCAMAINGFDATVVIPMIPAMAGDFNTSPASLGSIEWAFLLSSAVVLPLAAWLAQWQGTSRIFRWCLAGLCLGLLGAAIAGDPGVVVIARLVQGASSGVLVPVGLAMMYRGATGEDRLRITQITLIPLTLAPMLGPVVGGLVAEHLGWRWIFTALACFAAATFLAAFIFLPPAQRQPIRGVPDIFGLLLLAVGAGALTLLAPLMGEAMASHGVASLPFLGLCAAAACAALILCLALRRAKHHPSPALSLEPLNSPIYTLGMSTISIASLALSGFLFSVPLLLSARGYSLQSVGLVMFPETLGLLLGGQMMLPLKRRWGTRHLMIAGYAVAVAAALPVLLIDLPSLVTALFMLVFGLGLSQPVLLAQGAAFYEIAPEKIEDATTLFLVVRTVLSAWGVVVVMVLFQTDSGEGGPGVGANLAMAIAVLLLVAALCVLRLPSTSWEAATSAESPGAPS